jgi:thymidylate synthase (FAD)
MYDDLLKLDVAPEQARMCLPQSMYTSYYVTGSLSAYSRAYKLRIDSHAQKEIQDLAKMWDDIITKLFPVSWKELISGS